MLGGNFLFHTERKMFVGRTLSPCNRNINSKLKLWTLTTFFFLKKSYIIFLRSVDFTLNQVFEFLQALPFWGKEPLSARETLQRV